ncbi:MAG: cytochrome c3 family protein [Acidobacteriota bacterium]|nr:cytochrome c3 family protein [Acidobacteriota bacterium]
MRRAAIVILLLVFVASPARAQSSTKAPPAMNGCIDCHTVLDDARITPPAKLFADDVHAKAGFTCVFCHGGDARQEDQEKAHDPLKGFIGKPRPQQIPELCGKCHSDPALMKQYDPSQRVDQLAEYRTSGHGKALSRGDTTVAQCASCHGAHGIQPVKDSRSPVSPTKVAETCNHCHGDAALMAAHKLPSDPYEKWSRSVHYRARVGKGDLSAPTCNSCHGNHGAAPPQVGSVTNVCGTCHVTFADQFKLSPHWEPFKDMELPGCVTCHENHEIVKPTEAFLATGDQSKCSSCHEADSAGARVAAMMRADLVGLDGEIRQATRLVDRAEEAGMEVSRVRFDLVEATNALTKARSQVHLFRRSAVHAAVAEGLAVARKAAAGGEARLKERDYRQRGLFVSLGLILLSIAVLIVRIRERDRSTRESGE